LFDGVRQLGGEDLKDFASTAHIARSLNLPVLLVLDCSRLSGSIAAIAHGYRTFDPRIKVAGVVLNRVGSDRHLELLQEALEPLQLPILGILHRQDNITIPDRHLGLVPTDELSQIDTLIDRLAHLGETCFDWEQLLPLLKTSLHSHSPCPTPHALFLNLKIAVARDRAFSFYYEDNLQMLQDLGAELLFWSPLADAALPEGVQGLYFGGGFPEMFAAELSENIPVLQAVKGAIKAGMPTYAECGGLMYLCEQIVDFERQCFPMVGVLPTRAMMGDRLTLGYRRAVALQDSPMVTAGTTVWGHEFHRSRLFENSASPLFKTWGYNQKMQLDNLVLEGWQINQVHASYVHLHWGDRSEIPGRFLQHCASFEFEGG
jgi:cobyrinic acid a,c-diamide synthase